MLGKAKRVLEGTDASPAFLSTKTTGGESDLHRRSSSLATPKFAVKNAHTGQTEAYQPCKISILRDTIKSRWKVQPESQLLLNIQGQQLRGSDTLNEDLYVFDKTLSSVILDDEKLYTLDFESYKLSPDNMPKNMAQIQQSLQSQRDWSQKAILTASDLYERIEATCREILVVIEAVEVAAKYQVRQSKATESIFDQVLNYAVGSSRLLQNSNWQSVSTQLSKIHTIGSKAETLASWLDFGQVKKTSSDAEAISKLARSQMRDLKTQVDGIMRDTNQLSSSISKYCDSQIQTMETTIKRQLEAAAVSFQSIQSLRAKLESDATENLPSSEPEAHKVMTLHQQEFLPCSFACIEELTEICRRLEKVRKTRQQETKQMYIGLLNLQERCIPIRPCLSRIEASLQKMSDMVQFLHNVETLPFNYGAALIETIARKEWLDRVRLLANEAAEDIGKAREEEDKRRKKWIAAFPQNLIPSEYAPVYEQDGVVVPTIDIDLNAPPQIGDKVIHSISRAAVYEYIDTLAKVPDQEKAASTLRDIIQDLDKNTRRQGKRYFQLFSHNISTSNEQPTEDMKRRSISGTNVDGGDEAYQDERDLQRENVALSSKIKSYESRIRKLEDLLHKHSWRTGNEHITFNHYHHNLNGQNHTSLKQNVRRKSNESGSVSGPTSLMSVPADVDQQELLSRLMAQLNNERQTNAALRKQLASAEVNVEEIERTKHDLLANLAGQDSAFVNERKTLLQDMEKLARQQEVLEEENERFEEQNRLLECEYEGKLAAKNQELAAAREQVSELSARIDQGNGAGEFTDEQQKSLDYIEERLCVINGSDEPTEKGNQQIDRVRHLVDDISSQIVGPSLPIMKRRLSSRTDKARDLTQRLFTSHMRMREVLRKLGFAIVIEEENNTFHIVKLSKDVGVSSESQSPGAERQQQQQQPDSGRVSPGSNEGLETTVKTIYWISQDSKDDNNNNVSISPGKDYEERENELYQRYLASIRFDYDLFAEAIRKRVRDAEHLARKWRKEGKSYRDQAQRAMQESWYKIAFRGFKVGDLVLFLPTRNRNSSSNSVGTEQQQPWAAFNIGAPHYFLREDASHQLKNRDWLLGRISKVEERVVDRRRKQQQQQQQMGSSDGGGGGQDDDDNPFDLDDGLRWYLLDAVEEKGSVSPQHMYRALLSKESVQ